MNALQSIRWIASLPFFWAGLFLGTCKLPGCVPVLKTAWRLGHDDRMGATALRRIIQEDSSEAARIQAATWLAAHPRPEMACLAGLLAMEAGDWSEAAKMRKLCHDLGGDEEGLIDWLDLRVAGLENDDRTSEELYEKLSNRSDLSPQVSKMILNYYLFQALVAKQWDEVERRAKHMASIEESPLTATAFWALGRHRGKSESFGKYTKHVELDRIQSQYYQAVGYSATEDWEQAFEMLVLLRQADAQIADSLEGTMTNMGAYL
jgi:hypothetical protein